MGGARIIVSSGGGGRRMRGWAGLRKMRIAEGIGVHLFALFAGQAEDTDVERWCLYIIDISVREMREEYKRRSKDGKSVTVLLELTADSMT